MHPSNPPKGSLEDLFRHHLLESEAAAVAPRPQVWEQIDNSLLLAQNEKYRRRLAAYRWAVAASLLLASLAGGGWWHSQRQSPAVGTLARATPQSTGQTALATTRRATGDLATPTPAVAGLASGAGASRLFLSTSSLAAPTIDSTATLLASAHSATRLSSIAVRGQHHTTGHDHATSAVTNAFAGAPAGFVMGRYKQIGREPISRTLLAGTTSHLSPGQSPASSHVAAAGNTNPDNALTASAGTFTTTPSSTDEATLAYATPQPTATGAAAEATLATRLASLTAQATSLPTHLAEVEVAPGPALELSRGWQYGATYAVGAYNPNIDWVQAPVAVNNVSVAHPATYPNYPTSFGRSVASEYRDNLRPGLTQRLSLWATRRLGNGRWGLRTGVELTQSTATSASSVAFIGEPVADISYLQAGQSPRLQRTTYRYRSVSVPAELRYSNPLKTGFSLYGRLGALVTALLSVRSDVDGTPEATRTYAPLEGNSPYRRLSAGLRGGAGMQYRPAGHQWSVNFGPVAELGILSLNADGGQNFWTQQRPYSFGLEAGVELGRSFRTR